MKIWFKILAQFFANNGSKIKEGNNVGCFSNFSPTNEPNSWPIMICVFLMFQEIVVILI